jgi:integrase
MSEVGILCLFLPGFLGILWEKADRKKMARQIKSNRLDTRTARRSLERDKDYWQPIERGRSLKYRKGQNGGSWSARFYSDDYRREKKLGAADDTSDADGVKILDFGQALKKANDFFAFEQTNATGESPRGGPYTIADAARDYLKSLENREAPSYRGTVYDFERNILPFLGAIDAAKITRSRIETWRANLAARPRLSQKKKTEDAPPDAPYTMNEEEKRRRRATTNRNLGRLIAALNFAVENRKTHANPANWKIAKFNKAEVARADYLTEPEQREFVTGCADELEFQHFALAALQTGCRLSELAQLRVRNFDPTSKTVHIEQSKSGKARHVFLDEDGIDFFARLTRNRGNGELLFARTSGRSWDKDAVKLPMRRACKRGGIRRIGFHQLRHSFAVRLLMRRVPMKVVAQQLGHTSVRMLEKYYGHIVDAQAQQFFGDLPSAGLNQAAKAKAGTVIAIPSRERTA